MKTWMTGALFICLCSGAFAGEGPWTPLFNQSADTGEHRGNWAVKDGVLTWLRRGGGILTRDTYKDFELAFEWKISPGGNSGIKYRYTAYNAGTNGPEYQILDDAKNAGEESWSGTASMYLLAPRPPNVPMKKAGEWNTGRIVARGSRIEHWLNGTKVVDVDIGTPAFAAQVRKTKFKKMENYGGLEGKILFTDHNNPVWYRNIRIRSL